jgi:AraC family transcriptional regulator, regulatory protein of adaptative response / methylated-DNA-[protein]-cysteine methyltransferase
MRTSRKNGSRAAAAIEAAVWGNAAVARREDPRRARVLAREASSDGKRCRPDQTARGTVDGNRADDAIRFAVGDSSLGSVLVARSRGGICAILLGDDRQALLQELRGRFAEAGPAAVDSGADRELEELVAPVVDLVEAPAKGTNLPLDLRGTAFQRRVWRALQRIPPGARASYADIAARIGAPRAVRAVAQACAANALAVAIPCHRVVRRDGGLSGYRWGAERKRTLLSREAGM